MTPVHSREQRKQSRLLGKQEDLVFGLPPIYGHWAVGCKVPVVK